MIPHERSLVDDLKDKPFTLIGINSDKSLDYYRDQQQEMGFTWRSFWCGEDGTGGPIPSKWNVTSWPTIYVIDDKGVIRFKNVRGEAMTKAVESLLAEMK
jgi:Thioredoxin-like